jgi:hypothetical protein
MLANVWLNYVFAGEAQIWNLGCVTQRFYLTNKKGRAFALPKIKIDRGFYHER